VHYKLLTSDILLMCVSLWDVQRTSSLSSLCAFAINVQHQLYESSSFFKLTKATAISTTHSPFLPYKRGESIAPMRLERNSLPWCKMQKHFIFQHQSELPQSGSNLSVKKAALLLGSVWFSKTEKIGGKLCYWWCLLWNLYLTLKNNSKNSEERWKIMKRS